MQSRKSYFNGSLLWKDIRRFFPCWALYSVLLALLFFLTQETVLLDYGSRAARIALSLTQRANSFAMVYLFYAFLNAQVLFGYLYDSRACNGLHAMPVRREGWFLVHLSAGLLFALVPNLIYSLAYLFVIPEYANIVFYWFWITALEYFFLFGLSVFCTLLAGSRFAAVLIYGIFNLFPRLCEFIVDTLYLNLFPTVVLNGDITNQLSPIFFIDSVTAREWVEESGMIFAKYAGMGSSIQLIQYGIVIAVALVWFGLALLMYRKRKLEYAGDLLAVKWIQPLFLTVYTIAVSAIIVGLFAGSDGPLIYLTAFIGSVVGFFTGQMLIKRRVNVFSHKSIRNFGIFTAVFALSFAVAALISPSVVNYVPDPAKLSGASLEPGYYSHFVGKATEESDIRRITELHQYILENPDEWDADRESDFDSSKYWWVQITYTNAWGNKTQREFYGVKEGSALEEKLDAFFSEPRFIFGVNTPGELAEKIDSLSIVSAPGQGEYTMYIPQNLIKSFAEAVWADAQAENFSVCRDMKEEYEFAITFRGDPYFFSYPYTEDCENITGWISQHEEELNKTDFRY